MDKRIKELHDTVWKALDPETDFQQSSRQVLEALAAYEETSGPLEKTAQEGGELIQLSDAEASQDEGSARTAA